MWMCGGGRFSSREGPFASHQLRMSLAGPRGAAEGPAAALIDSRLDAACHLPALVFAH